MNEAQRFLRYILPGLIFFVEFLGYLFISGDLTFCKVRAWVNGTDNTTGVVIGAFLGSGAIGFLFGVLHYKIVWLFDKTGVNHRPIFQIAEDRKWLKLVHAKERREVRAAELTKRGAYRVVNTYLIRRAEACKEIKGVIPRTERLADLVNALGTICIGSVFAVTSFLLYNIRYSCPGQFSLPAVLTLIVGVIIAILHISNYRDVCEDCKTIHDMILMEAFEFEYKQRDEPIRLYVFQEDLEEKWTWVKYLIYMIPVFAVVMSLKKCIFK